MRRLRICCFVILLAAFCSSGIHEANGAVLTQCPANLLDPATGSTDNPNIVCKHLVAGDGFIKLADGSDSYIFSFADVTGVPDNQIMETGMLAANFSAPTLFVKEGQEFYLSLTNVGMAMRPDLFDPHTVHFHGFPNAASVFDGEPMASIAINMGASLTYYYNIVEPGTYMYHCHVEASEHMQMGMLGNIYVLPAQDDLPDGTVLGSHVHHPDPDGNGPLPGDRYAYNDGDGSTRYDVSYPIQMVGFDPGFHEEDLNIQPLSFAAMTDTYAMLNGRGYPDTTNPGVINNLNGHPSQQVSSLITATQGQTILLRISSLSTTDFYTLTALGIPMQVVGNGARLLRGPDPDGPGPLTGKNLYYSTSSVTLGGGEAVDVLLDTSAVAPGRYYLYTTNLNSLNNGDEDFGGMMTEIVIN